MGKGIVKLGEGQWAVKDGNLLSAKETNGRFKNTEFTVTRGTRASYVGRDGLIKESNLQDVNLVNNGDFSELGSEVITNGTFDTDSDWSESGSWTYDSLNQSYKTTNDSISSLQQNGVTEIGKTYKLTFNVSSAPNGFSDFRIINSAWSDTYVDASEAQLGENTFYINVVNGTGIRFRVENLYEIDNISVKEVDPNDYWTFSGDSFTFPDGAARIARTTSTTFIQQNVLTSGKLYKVEFDVLDKDDNNGTFIVRLGSNNVYDVSTYEGTRFSKYITSAGVDFRIYSSSDNGVIYVDNIVVSEVKTDTPRIDFTDNTDGHLLLEPQSTNLLPYSEDFTTWTVNAATTVYSNTTETLSPSGEYNASKITSDGSNGLYKAVAFGGGDNTKSIYLKGIVGGEQVILRDPAQTITQKTLTLTTDWVRYDLSENQTSTIGLWINEIPSNGIYMWGGQLEALSYATSYIPTNGSTVTRDAETCTGAGSSADFNSEEGVLYVEISALANDGTFRMIGVSDSTENNKIDLYYRSNFDQITLRLISNGVQQIFEKFDITATNFSKMAFRYKSGESNLFIDGVKQKESNYPTVSMPIGLSELAFDNGAGTDNFYGKCKAIRVYKEALSDTDLQNLTS